MCGVRSEVVEKMEDLMPLILESLRQGQSVRFFPRGTSMMPMLRQQIDSVVISPIPGKLKKWDIPFYKRDNGQYTLHRIVEVSDTYTCMGDNQFQQEPGIRQDQLIAVVTGFYRGEKYHAVNEPLYRGYCYLWNYSRPLRRFWRRGIGYLRRKFR